MFQENKEFKDRVNDTAVIYITLPQRWHGTDNPYGFVPREIRVGFSEKTTAHSAPMILRCYFTLEKGTLRVSHLSPSPDFALVNARMKGLVDAYTNKVLLEFIKHAKQTNANRLVVESNLPQVADSFLDLGFKARTQGDIYVGEYSVK
jgi:hypothetical protein